MDIIVKITEQEYRVLESWLGEGEVEKWIQHALNNKVRQRVDASLEEVSDLNPKRLTKEAKLTELARHTLPTREERDIKERDRNAR